MKGHAWNNGKMLNFVKHNIHNRPCINVWIYLLSDLPLEDTS